jgi:glycosyltransferase involved in cell wall biosynthesis
MDKPRVSFVIVAKNEEYYLPFLLDDVVAQGFPYQKMEILLVGGPSTDGTLELMRDFKNRHPERNCLVLPNDRGILASGWNIALAESKGDIIIRVDAHARLGPQFISRSVDLLSGGHCIVGGHLDTVMPKRGWARLLAVAEISRFGSGSAMYKRMRNAGYVDTLGYAAYRREVFGAVGGYDERLVRTEDNEIHYRMKKAGYKFYYSPAIRSHHYPRESLMRMVRQKYGNGLWIGLTMSIQPKCFGLRHFIPGLFVVVMCFCAALGFMDSWAPLIVVLGLYGLTSIAFSFGAASRHALQHTSAYFLLPGLFLLIHLSYGSGIILGVIASPVFRFRHRRYQLPWPVKNNDNASRGMLNG